MKKSTNVVSFRKKKFGKKYGDLFENYKYILIILVVPVILSSLFMVDKFIMKIILSQNGIDYNQYYETRIENSIDEEFRENYKNN